MKNQDICDKELVILMNGNYCAIPIATDIEGKMLVEMLSECYKKSITEPETFLNYKGFFVFVRHVVGFYFRKKTNYLETQERAVKAMEKMVDGGDADTWKNDE